LISTSPRFPSPEEHFARRSARDIAYLQLRQWIVTGELAPGSSITEVELAARVGVSRTPLREGIKTLETQGFVRKLTNGRLVVVGLSARDLSDLYSVRAAMERLIVKSVVDETSDNQVTETLGPIVAGIRHNLSLSLPEMSSQGENFHYALAQLCQNEVARDFLWELRERIARYRTIGPANSLERRVQAAHEHIEIYELVIARRSEEAASAMEEHIHRSQDVALRYLAGGLNDEISGSGN
jgi:DNA-binding GntR family transcriptional regulator